MAGTLDPILQKSSFSLDDIVIPPIKIPIFSPSEVDLTTRLTKKIELKIPILSAPMDTVTEAKMAILLACLGGIGVIHNNLSIESQVKEITTVRRYKAGFVIDPVVIGKDATIGQVRELGQKLGFDSFPITEDGSLKTSLIGIVTNRDTRYKDDLDQPITQVMTPIGRLVTAKKSETLDKNDIRLANQILRKHNLDTLIVVDNKNRVMALVTGSDLRKNDQYHHATKDDNQQLKVLAAVESRLDLAADRILAVAEAGVSGIVIDARNIQRGYQELVRFARKKAPNLDIIVGNVVHPAVIKEVMDEVGGCIDAFRVGIGGGEVCVTSENLGIGRALGRSVYEVNQTIKHYQKKFGHVGIIADGGIKSPAHILIALTLGADAVMMGSNLAGFEESPGIAIQDNQSNYLVKQVRGMGSAEVMKEKAGASRYGVDQQVVEDRFPEGIVKKVPYVGSGEKSIRVWINGLKTAMQALGYVNVEQLYKNAHLEKAHRSASKGSL